jgi:hypothetical protein
VNDEEGGIKKLVMEVFQAMLFSPVRDKPALDFNAPMRKVFAFKYYLLISNTEFFI